MTMAAACTPISQRRVSTRSAIQPPTSRKSSSGSCPIIWVSPKRPADWFSSIAIRYGSSTIWMPLGTM